MEAKSVKRFERSNGLDTALHKNYLFTFYFLLMGYSGLNSTKGDPLRCSEHELGWPLVIPVVARAHIFLSNCFCRNCKTFAHFPGHGHSRARARVCVCVCALARAYLLLTRFLSHFIHITKQSSYSSVHSRL